MARKTSVSLGDHFTEFIEKAIESGRYATASEVVRDGLRLLEEEEIQLETLSNALTEGELSGPSNELNLEEFLAARRESAALH